MMHRVTAPTTWLQRLVTSAGGGRLTLRSSFIVGVNEPHSIGTLSSAAQRSLEGGWRCRVIESASSTSRSSGSSGSPDASTAVRGRASPAISRGEIISSETSATQRNGAWRGCCDCDGRDSVTFAAYAHAAPDPLHKYRYRDTQRVGYRD
eukprot:scaffold76888_cov69-Phaeocystis_antarctica.AAC.2